jgi:hypothetical protein
MDFLALVLLLFLPLVLFGSLLLASNWLYDRIFGNEVDPEDAARRRKVFHLDLGQFIPRGTSRESKATPHYDALVEEEWRVRRLEDKTKLEDSSEIHSLTDLLEDSEKE